MPVGSAKEDNSVDLGGGGSDSCEPCGEREDGQSLHRLFSSKWRVHVHSTEVFIQVFDPLKKKEKKKKVRSSHTRHTNLLQNHE